MNKSNTALGAAFALLLSAAMVLFQSQSAIPGAGTGSSGLGTVSVDAPITGNGSSGSPIDCQDASAAQSGCVTTGAQTFAGAKTFNGAVIAQNANTLGYQFASGAILYSGASAAGDVGFIVNGGTQFSVNNGSIRPGGNDTADLGTTALRWNEAMLGTDGLNIDFTDSSGSPGAATINKTSGTSCIATGASTVVITSSKAATTSRINITQTTSNAGCMGAPWWVTKAAGSFTVNAPANCTVTAGCFDWLIVK